MGASGGGSWLAALGALAMRYGGIGGKKHLTPKGGGKNHLLHQLLHKVVKNTCWVRRSPRALLM